MPFGNIVVSASFTDTLLRIAVRDINTFHTSVRELEELAQLIKANPLTERHFYDMVTDQLTEAVKRGREAERSLETLLSAYYHRLTVIQRIPVDDFYVFTLHSLTKLREYVNELALYLLIRSVDQELSHKR